MNTRCKRPFCCALACPQDICVDAPLAVAYVPVQCWRSIYGPEDGLLRGTIFAELDLPFGAEGGGRQ